MDYLRYIKSNKFAITIDYIDKFNERQLVEFQLFVK